MPDQDPIIIVGPDGTEHEFPAGMDPKRAAAIVRGQSGGAAPAQSSGVQRIIDALPGMGPGGVGIKALIDTVQGIRKDPTSAVPMVTGAIGGAVGGPAGAAVGGAIGNPIQNLTRIALNRDMDKVPSTFAGTLVGVGKEAALQGGLQKVPDVLGKAVPKLLRSGARGIEEGVLKPVAKITQENPNVDLIKTVLENKIRPWDPSTVMRAKAPLLTKRAGLIDAAEQAGVEGDLNPVASGLDRWIAEHQATSSTPEQGAAAARRIIAEITNHPAYPIGQVPARELMKMKEAVDPSSFGSSLGESTANEIAKRQRFLLKQETERIIPGMKEANAELAPLMAVDKAVSGGRGYGKGSAARIGSHEAGGWRLPMLLGSGLLTGVATGNPVAGGATGLALTAAAHPRVQGLTAQGMWNLANASEQAATTPELANLLRVALLKLMSDGQASKEP